jgi:hypothetical protein
MFPAKKTAGRFGLNLKAKQAAEKTIRLRALVSTKRLGSYQGKLTHDTGTVIASGHAFLGVPKEPRGNNRASMR